MNDSESKKKFQSKKIFFGSFSKFHKIGHISWTTKAFRLIFSGMIVLDSAFQNIKTVFKMTFNFFYKKLKTVEKSIFSIIFEWSRVFPENPAVSGTPTHHPLSSCQKSKKSLERLLRSGCDKLPTDYGMAICSTEVENCNVHSDLLNFSDFFDFFDFFDFLLLLVSSIIFDFLANKLKKWKNLACFAYWPPSKWANLFTYHWTLLSTFKLCNINSYHKNKLDKMTKI